MLTESLLEKEEWKRQHGEFGISACGGIVCAAAVWIDCCECGNETEDV